MTVTTIASHQSVIFNLNCGTYDTCQAHVPRPRGLADGKRRRGDST